LPRGVQNAAESRMSMEKKRELTRDLPCRQDKGRKKSAEKKKKENASEYFAVDKREKKERAQGECRFAMRSNDSQPEEKSHGGKTKAIMI